MPKKLVAAAVLAALVVATATVGFALGAEFRRFDLSPRIPCVPLRGAHRACATGSTRCPSPTACTR